MDKNKINNKQTKKIIPNFQLKVISFNGVMLVQMHLKHVLFDSLFYGFKKFLMYAFNGDSQIKNTFWLKMFEIRICASVLLHIDEVIPV